MPTPRRRGESLALEASGRKTNVELLAMIVALVISVGVGLFVGRLMLEGLFRLMPAR